MQQLFSAFVDELEGFRSQDSSFINSARPFQDFLKTVKNAQLCEDRLELGTLHLLTFLEVKAVDSDDRVSDSCINESESCIGIPHLFLTETIFDSLYQFESHVLHRDAGKVREYIVHKEGTAETFFVDFEREVSFFKVLEILNTRSKWLSFLESVQRLCKEASDLEH